MTHIRRLRGGLLQLPLCMLHQPGKPQQQREPWIVRPMIGEEFLLKASSNGPTLLDGDASSLSDLCTHVAATRLSSYLLL